MTVENTKAIKADDNLVMIVYGKGGVGKTTFAASAPNALILDFENGTKYLGDRGFEVNVVRMKSWLTTQDKNDLLQLMMAHDTIVVDPLGEAMDKLIDSPEINGPKYRTHDGSLTMAGWGEVKKQMRNFIKWLRDTGKNIIIVSHVTEIATDNGLEHRIQVATKLSDEIPNIVDVISYLGIQKRGDVIARMLFTPAQGGSFDSKDRTGRVPMTVEISERNGWQDLMDSLKPMPRDVQLAQEASPVQQAPSQPVMSSSEPTAGPTAVPIAEDRQATLEQKKEMLVLAEKMGGPGADYLRLMSASPVTFAVAQQVIDRATAFIGGK